LRRLDASGTARRCPRPGRGLGSNAPPAPGPRAIGQIQSKIVCRPATTATPTTNTTPAPPSCATLQARKQQLEEEKLDQRKKEIGKQYKGKDAAARKHALDVERHNLDQAEHALDQQLKGCH
jgi:capsule polysaccharide export protein KpsE/RkpR